MSNEIAKLHKRLDASIIYVAHDQTEAMTMADKIIIMKNGLFQQIGHPLEVCDYHNNIFPTSIFFP
jgi:multiple sugar transport system ATP-binding protein